VPIVQKPPYRTGVSLHSHTLHSEERLDFLYRLAGHVAPLRVALRLADRRHRAAHGVALDLNRAWWTPPLSPHCAWVLERNHIESLGLNAIVSLTDHDNIDAHLALGVLDECRGVPVSVEWSVPYRGALLHIGVHNLPRGRASRFMNELAAFTSAPDENGPAPLLEALARLPDSLVILNHPLWDEIEAGQELHEAAVRSFVARYGRWIHAVEWNGLRSWRENRLVIELARAFGKPVVSGGDRHGLEPSAVINLTNANTFSEFAQEIREGRSEMLLAHSSLDPRALRLLHTIADVMSEMPGHARGWKRWTDRIFYRDESGRVRSFSELWRDGPPLALQLIARTLRLTRHETVRQAFRLTFARQPAPSGFANAPAYRPSALR
jgi:hypothetical protein